MALSPKGERVLYAGGRDANGVGVLKSAEEFLGFPVCAYLPTGDLKVARYGYSAIRLSSNNLDPSVQRRLPRGWAEFQYLVSTPAMRESLREFI